MRRILIYILAVAAFGYIFAQQSTPTPALSARHSSATETEAGVDSASPAAPCDLRDTLSTDSAAGARVQSIAETMRAMRGGLLVDSVPEADSTRTRFTKINRTKTDIEGTVNFSAKDSLVLHGLNNAFLYGDGTVEYQDFKLNSGEIRMELDSSTVYATGRPDSIGNVSDNPIFHDKSGEYESETMKYNFKSQRGYITGVITEQQEGYLTGERAKRVEDGSFYVEGGRYTTCDDHEHPHFYFQLTKAKVRPKKDVVTGPGYVVLADVPLPLALPFGYFPFSEKYSSGVIFPTFGDDYNQGFYLRNGGYYFAISDYVDLALRGEIYTKGSWGLSASSTYYKRYAFRGQIDISFLNTVYGYKGDPDYTRMRNFQVIWSHSQDGKANPNLSFSAAVNFATTGYTRNDLNSYYSSAFTENTKSSTVNMTYRFPGSNWSISATANITQRTQDSTLQVGFPNLNVTMTQLAPFKRKKAVGKERWYEKIRMSYSGQFQNSLTSRQDEFFQKNILKDWKNGMRHTVPVSATFSLFKYLNVSPSVTLNDRMYTSKIRRQWDTQASAEVQDTTFGFYNLFDFNAALAFDTKVYGFWKPMKFLGDKVQMIRHVMTPTVSVNWNPDFSMPGWGVYGSYMRPGYEGGPEQKVEYSYFEHGIFGAPSRGRSGAVTLSLANNLEMKVRDDNDSTGSRKVSLIENLNLSQSYNFAADSLRLSPLQASIMLRLVKDFNLNLNTTWDPYCYRLNEAGTPVKVDRYVWQDHRGLALSSFGTSFSYTFNNNTFRRKNSQSDRNKTNSENDDEEASDETSDDFSDLAARRRNKQKQTKADDSDSDGYYKWEFPWSLSLNYSVSYGYGTFNYEKMRYNGRWNQNLSISGNLRPTENWNFSFTASYDFDAHKLAYMNCTISRDLHCFTMSASFVPVGPYKSYNFHIAVKSSLLKDLKYDQRSQSNNGIQWY